jgi:hypothetical protein
MGRAYANPASHSRCDMGVGGDWSSIANSLQVALVWFAATAVDHRNVWEAEGENAVRRSFGLVR